MSIEQMRQELKALREAHQRLMEYVCSLTQWQPDGADALPPGSIAPFCRRCQTCHFALCGCPGTKGPAGMLEAAQRERELERYDEAELMRRERASDGLSHRQ